jgi:hypothetical protein
MNSPAKRNGRPGITGSTTPKTPIQTHSHPTTVPNSEPGLFRCVIQPGTLILFRLGLVTIVHVSSGYPERTYLATLTEDELKPIVTLHDSPQERYTVDGLLWHVMIHEMRHTAQIAVLLRTQGIKPPSLDLFFYLPSA